MTQSPRWKTSCFTQTDSGIVRQRHAAPLRPEIERRLRAELASHGAGVQILALRLDYRDDGLRIDVVLDGPVGDEASLRDRLEASLEPLLAMPAAIILTSSST